VACSKGSARNISKVCSPWLHAVKKLPLHNLPNQHKAKIEPGKLFVKSEPHRQVKFLEKCGTVIQFSVKFKGSLKRLSPGEMPMPNGHRRLRFFGGKHGLLSPAAQ